MELWINKFDEKFVGMSHETISFLKDLRENKGNNASHTTDLCLYAMNKVFGSQYQSLTT